jgi:hypothetical protein
MPLEYIPLLNTQREIYKTPLGVERFKTYINTILNSSEDDVELAPLAAMNPMAKEHAKMCLDKLLAQNADVIAANAIAEFQSRTKALDAFGIRASLVLVDDAKGGWTNRTLNEFHYFFEFDKTSFFKRPWLTIPCWTNDEDPHQNVHATTLAYLYRLAYVLEHGQAKTLRDMLKQEGEVLRFAGVTQWLDEEELTYTKAVVEKWLESTLKPVHIACLYGDKVAKSVGYEALGLGDRAGFALALNNTEKSNLTSETAP